MSSTFLKSLLKVSEKAANIARVCRRNEHLFQLLVQEKKSDEKNPRFVQDFKTLADVLIQEMVKHDIGIQFPTIAPHIRGEESNSFSNTLGDTITVRIESSQELTAALLSQVLGGNSEAAELLALEVHKEIELDHINIGNVELPIDLMIPIDQLGIWIDPIDSTAEYISGEENPLVGDVHSSGLQCVTVLIGVFDRATGSPVMGVINQPFHTQNDSLWRGQCQWGIRYKDIKLSSVFTDSTQSHRTHKVIAISASENPTLKARLLAGGYHLVEAAGAGYKLLCVALGRADVYVLSKGTTFRWDTCAPHAILCSLGGDVINYKQALKSPGSTFDGLGLGLVVNYEEQVNDWCNHDGIIAFTKPELAQDIINLLADQ